MERLATYLTHRDKISEVIGTAGKCLLDFLECLVLIGNASQKKQDAMILAFNAMTERTEASNRATLKEISKLAQEVIIRNKKPGEAVPVRLVSKTGKDFYNVESTGGGTFISDNKLSYGKGIVAINPISVGSTEQVFTLPVGKKFISIQNKGPALVAFGPTGLNYDDYPTLTPRQFYEFIDCKDGFKVYFICDTSKTSTIVGFTR